MAFEIACHNCRTRAYLTKVYGLASISEQKEPVKCLKEHGGWLVDGTQDGLSAICKFSEKLTDRPCGLAVEAGSWFIWIPEIKYM